MSVPKIVSNNCPPSLSSFIRPVRPQTDITANVGYSRILTTDIPTMKPIFNIGKRGPLIMHDKRWYFTLKPKETQRCRALTQDYKMERLNSHLIICYTPEYLPNQNKKFLNHKGKPGRIFALFDSYLEFYHFMNKYPVNERSFYEVILGPFAQKPHFDIDIDRKTFEEKYPQENFELAADIIIQNVIKASIKVLDCLRQPVSIAEDILVYSSHGQDKRSFHLLVNNKCHADNQEARAFAECVLHFFKEYTNNKYAEFIDQSVYSSVQQFRILGSSKVGNTRYKIFNEKFMYENKQYTHIYNEPYANDKMKELVQLYESLIGFISGCNLLPSLVYKRSSTTDFSDIPDIADDTVRDCIAIVKSKMDLSPFSLGEIKGRTIFLVRDYPSYCDTCERTHHAENAFLAIRGGKIYFDCRRWREWAPEKGRLCLGSIDMSQEPNNVLLNISDNNPKIFYEDDFESEEDDEEEDIDEEDLEEDEESVPTKEKSVEETLKDLHLETNKKYKGTPVGITSKIDFSSMKW